MPERIKFSKKPLLIEHYGTTQLPVFTYEGGHEPRLGKLPNRRVIAYRIYRMIRNYGYDLLRYYCIDGFIERQMKQWIQRYVKKGVVLDVGMGDGRLMRHIPVEIFYLGFDPYIRQELVIKLSHRGMGQLFVASATDIPLPDRSVDCLLSTEVMEHINGYKRAIREMYRVAKPGAKLLLSIPNNYCYKYHQKGPHPEHVNNWRYKEFIEVMAPYFRLIEGRMTGWWWPFLPHVRYSYQLNYSHPDEYYNTNFLFVFEKI